MYNFDVKENKENLIKWIKDYFKNNGTEETVAVIGISGGKDSSVVAAACVEALGKDRVIGVKMPNATQKDIDYSNTLINWLGIKSYEINIGATYLAMEDTLKVSNIELNDIVTINTPARIRMMTLYAVSASLGGRVANTCNLSEDWVGYATKYGDGAGDFSPLSNYTVHEVKELGKELGLPTPLIEKTPIDGLCGQTDEEKLGFTYEILDKYLREGICEDKSIKEKIDKMHSTNMHKLFPMPSYVPRLEIKA